MAPFNITLTEKRSTAIPKGRQRQQHKNGNVDAALRPILRNLNISFTLPLKRGPSVVPPPPKKRAGDNVSVHYMGTRSKSSRNANEYDEEVDEVKKDLIKMYTSKELPVIIEGIEESQRELELVRQGLCALQKELRSSSQP
uniref:Uncharacterized protein n=1 Tax=Fagus sylvatica TaxID=28930 RepID=A0A2N9IM93_FAGSY